MNWESKMTDLKRILYVEDEPDIQTVAKMALELIGHFEVCVCSSGEEALATAEAADPQLILLDVMMPRMDGPTTLGHLKQMPRFQSTPIVFMTAKAQPKEVEQFKSLGAVDVIAKPFDPMALPDTLRDIWAKYGAG